MEEEKRGRVVEGNRWFNLLNLTSRVPGCEGEYVSYSVCCWPFFFPEGDELCIIWRIFPSVFSSFRFKGGGGQASRSGGVHAVSK